MPKARETRSGAGFASGQTGPGEGKRYMATPAPVIRSAQVSILAHRAARNVSASPGSGQWITERRAVTRKWR